MRRFIHAIGGLIIVAIGDIAISWLATGIQQRFPNQISNQALWILAGLSLLGLLVGYYLGGPVKVPSTSTSPSASTQTSNPQELVTITRLRALFSYSRLKGKGIHLSDILLIGSRIDIES